MAILGEESKVLQEIREIVTYKLLNDSSVDETTSTAVDVLDSEAITLLVESSAGVSGGVVTLEAARTADFAGTWASLGTVTTDAATAVFLLTIDTGDAAGVPVPFVRARVSTVMTGGTVDAYLIKRR